MSVRHLRVPCALLSLALLPGLAHAFCGFFVGKADAALFNDASRVIYVREGTRSVITMLNDYRGELAQFAMVVPVPEVLPRAAIRVVDPSIFERIDGYSAPRLAEYFDPDPCRPPESVALGSLREARRMSADAAPARRERAHGVKVEARYTVGEYDIAILSARESDGLETWLRENGYRIPTGASRALRPYIRQGMKFFVARVNLGEHAKGGRHTLRPLQFAFDSPRFMLPVRLGTLNAQGPQDLVIFLLTRNGRVETTNYRTVKLPADMELPTFVRSDFASFYRAMFDQQATRGGLRTVFTEYFWDMGWCDPCAADPLTGDELRTAGVSWLEEGGGAPDGAGGRGRAETRSAVASGAQPVMLTRLHLRYTADTLPEDLMFQETRDRQNYQARYVLRHAWQGSADACEGARAYAQDLEARREREGQTLAGLTGWPLAMIRSQMARTAPVRTPRELQPRPGAR